MAVSRLRRAVLIHGLPHRGCVDPIDDQLGDVRRLCESLGIRAVPYRWADCSPLSAARALARIRRTDRSFLEEEALKFGAWLTDEMRDLPSEARFIVVAYSAGGAIFYRWLASGSGGADRLAIAVTIAAPHTMPNPVFFEDQPQVGYEVGEPGVRPDDIVAQLAAHGSRLNVVLGSADLTIPAAFARFASTDEVEQVIVPFATHASIRSHPVTLEQIAEWLR